jgi:hypothetical protein
MQIGHLKTHGYSSWNLFLIDYPSFNDTEWKAHSQKASRKFWDQATTDQISLRRDKQLTTWYSAEKEEQTARKTRRSQKTKQVWETLPPEAYVDRCKNIGDGFKAATTVEQRREMARKANSCNPSDQAQRCSKGMKQYWENLTDKEYYELCLERSRFWSEMPLDEYDSRCAEFKLIWENRSSSEKEKLKEIYRKNIRKSFGCKESWIEKACKADLNRLEHVAITQYSSLFIDLYIPALNLAIELYGTYWHCDPRKIEQNFLHPHRKIKATDIWERDAKKQKEITKKHNLLIIWERDYSIDILNLGIQANLASPNEFILWTSLTSSQ